VSEEPDITKNLRAIARRLRLMDFDVPVAERVSWSLDIDRAATRLGGDGRWGGISDPELEFLGFATQYWNRRFSLTKTKRALVESLSRELARRGRRAPVWTDKEHPWVGLDTEDLRRVLSWAEAAKATSSADEIDKDLLHSLREELLYWREDE
jgi:hypothetical protein